MAPQRHFHEWDGIRTISNGEYSHSVVKTSTQSRTSESFCDSKTERSIYEI